MLGGVHLALLARARAASTFSDTASHALTLPAVAITARSSAPMGSAKYALTVSSASTNSLIASAAAARSIIRRRMVLAASIVLVMSTVRGWRRGSMGSLSNVW